MIDHLSRVDRLLVLASRVDLDTGAGMPELEQACRSFRDWSSLPARAGYQGVIAWAQEALLRMPDGIVPAEVLDRLRQARIVNIARIASTSTDLSDIAGAFRKAGIRHILLKGPFLAKYVYPRPDLRYYTDIDMLIPEADRDRAGAVLAGIGYEAVGPVQSASLFEWEMTQAHYYRPRSLPLDLHWELINLPSHNSAMNVDMNEIWNAAVPIEIGGVKSDALSPEDVLLFQCMHMTAHHDFNRFLWFKDVEAVVRRFGPDLDWRLFADKCGYYGLKASVYYSLLVTADALGEIGVPAWVMAELRPRFLMARLFERLARGSSVLEMQSNRRRPAIEVWKVMRDDRSNRWKAIARRTFPEVRWYLECYPFLPKLRRQRLYYCAYPALMILRAIKRPIQLDLSETRETR